MPKHTQGQHARNLHWAAYVPSLAENPDSQPEYRVGGNLSGPLPAPEDLKAVELFITRPPAVLDALYDHLMPFQLDLMGEFFRYVRSQQYEHSLFPHPYALAAAEHIYTVRLARFTEFLPEKPPSKAWLEACAPAAYRKAFTRVPFRVLAKSWADRGYYYRTHEHLIYFALTASIDACQQLMLSIEPPEGEAEYWAAEYPAKR